MRLILIIILACITAACNTTPAPEGPLPTVAALPSLTPSITASPSDTPTQTLTPTATLTPTITPTPTLSVTPSATITDTPTPTYTASPSPTPRQSPLLMLAQIAAEVTVLPQQLQPTPIIDAGGQSLPPGEQLPSSCPVLPPGGFGTLLFATPALNSQLGCAQGTVNTVNSASQPFERGFMIWVNGPIYALFNDGRYQQHADTFVAGVDPESGGEVPPAGLVEPVRGFGKVWRTAVEVRSGLGWGTTGETGGTATVQRFERGWMIDLSQREDILVLVENPGGSGGTWQAYPGSY